MTDQLFSKARLHQRFRSSNQTFLSQGVLLLSGVILSALLAFLVVKGLWIVSLVIVIALPAALLLVKYPLVSIMIWLLLMPFLFFPQGNPDIFWVLHRGMIPFAAILTLLSRLLKLKPYQPVRLSWAEGSMIMYLAVVTVSAFFIASTPLSLNLRELYDSIGVPFAIYFLVRLANPGEKDLKRWTLIMLIIIIMEIIIGFWASYAPQTLPAFWVMSREGTRMSGTMTQPTPYAYLLIFCMVFLFHYAMNNKSRFISLSLLAIFSLGLLCIFLTYTRGVWIGAVFFLCGLLIIYPKPVSILLTVIFTVFAVLFLSVLSNEMSVAIERLTTQDTINDRIVLNHAAEQMFYSRPIFGWGINDFNLYKLKFIELVGDVAPTYWDIYHGTSHNTYLTILAETGLVGFIFQIFPFLWWLVLSIKLLPRLPVNGFWSRKLLMSIWLSIGFYGIGSQFIDMRFFWLQLGLLWLTLGLVGNLLEPYLRLSSTGGTIRAK